MHLHLLTSTFTHLAFGKTQELPACSWLSFLYSYHYILKLVMNFELIFIQNIRLKSSLLSLHMGVLLLQQNGLQSQSFLHQIALCLCQSPVDLSAQAYFCIIYLLQLLMCPYLSISFSYYKYLISSNRLIIFHATLFQNSI